MPRQLAILGVALTALAACARPYAPPGGDPDRLPPALVTTNPAPFTVWTQLEQPVVFRFDERLRTRTFTRALVSVSPGSPADIEFHVSGNEVRVRPRGGWLPGQIYRVVLRPGVEDMFSNRRLAEAELVFSTGPQVPPSALAGLIEDRMTRRPARDAIVEAVRRNDSTVYRAWADSAAFFALRYIPYGTYDLYAYADGNRNGRRDPSEARDIGVTASVGPGQDTVQVFFELLPNDSTPPRPLRAEPQDSVHVRITFDDAIDPDSGLVAATATIFALPDSTLRPGRPALLLEAAATAAARARRAAADSAAADSAARARARTGGDSAAAPPAPARPPAPVAGGRPGAAAPAAQNAPTEPLPEKIVVLSTDAPFAPGEYVLVISGARNVNGLVGGGSVRFTVKPPAAPARAPADTTAARQRGDTLPASAGRPPGLSTDRR